MDTEQTASPMRVSIAMATFNGEKYLREQLDSLAAQTILPYELVVTDDGSTDRTLEIVEAFSMSTNILVKVYQNGERLGPAENFLKAASLCSADFVAFCDQDDVWIKSKLEICLWEFKDPDVLLCLHSSKVWAKGQLNHRRPDFKRRNVLKPNSSDPLTFHPGFSMVIRKSLLGIISSEKRPVLPHDQWVWFLSSIFGRIVCVPTTLAFWRRHDGNTSVLNRHTLLRHVVVSIKTLNYEKLAIESFECANFLRQSATNLTPELKARCLNASSRFETLGNYLRLRARIYNYNASLGRRLLAFLKITISGGYFQDSAKSRLGLKAGTKDCFFGVTGLYRVIGPKLN